MVRQSRLASAETDQHRAQAQTGHLHKGQSGDQSHDKASGSAQDHGNKVHLRGKLSVCGYRIDGSRSVGHQHLQNQIHVQEHPAHRQNAHQQTCFYFRSQRASIF